MRRSCLLFLITANALAAFAPPMRNEPTPGLYRSQPLVGVTLHVQSAASVRVKWSDGRTAGVHYEDDRGFVMSEPLASYARERGVIISRVDFDDARDAIDVHVDGRMAFTATFHRVDDSRQERDLMVGS